MFTMKTSFLFILLCFSWGFICSSEDCEQCVTPGFMKPFQNPEDKTGDAGWSNLKWAWHFEGESLYFCPSTCYLCIFKHVCFSSCWCFHVLVCVCVTCILAQVIRGNKLYFIIKNTVCTGLERGWRPLQVLLLGYSLKQAWPTRSS